MMDRFVIGSFVHLNGLLVRTLMEPALLARGWLQEEEDNRWGSVDSRNKSQW